MNILIKNLGPLKQAQFSLGELTIICGENNTGKTYATYALFGFLSFWHESYSIPVPRKSLEKLLEDGVLHLDITDYSKNAQTILDQGCKEFTEHMPHVFASSKKHFAESDFCIDLGTSGIEPLTQYEQSLGTAKSRLLSITKEAGASTVIISLLVTKEKMDMPQSVLRRIIGDHLKRILFGRLFPEPFIASAERTGAAIFRKELNFARNRLLEEIGPSNTEFDPFQLLNKVYSDYALPVRRNVDFTRQLETLFKEESQLAQGHPGMVQDFADIIGGDYVVTKNDELYFTPKGKRLRLTMEQSSSAVRSMLDIGFYIKHMASPGDMLMVDEPELNLHPKNQRRVARLFARLINAGVKVFITTHSDYIIKELNTLIMLRQDDPRLRALARAESYHEDELLQADKVKVYIAEEDLILPDGASRRSRHLTLTPADIDPALGIEARSFDKTIDDMNRIQDEILWGLEQK